MTLDRLQRKAAGLLILLDLALLIIFVLPMTLSLLRDGEIRFGLILLALSVALGVPLVVLVRSGGRRLLLAWGIFLAVLVFAFGTCSVLLSGLA